MTTITIDVSPETYARLTKHAEEQGKAPNDYFREVLENSLPPTTYPEKTAKELLKEAGMVIELSDELRKYIDEDTPSLDEVIEILTASQGPTLTEILEQQRGPKP